MCHATSSVPCHATLSADVANGDVPATWQWTWMLRVRHMSSMWHYHVSASGRIKSGRIWVEPLVGCTTLSLNGCARSRLVLCNGPGSEVHSHSKEESHKGSKKRGKPKQGGTFSKQGLSLRPPPRSYSPPPVQHYRDTRPTRRVLLNVIGKDVGLETYLRGLWSEAREA
ncbi:hypothetical protein LIER_02944 [Lithospermum erythrorhizon]|uniref:Uncharacterized protein n=1 Tax=Lithospermum erythrorhizon TaxID=34254 RepID=A0AAV3NRE0_LITER